MKALVATDLSEPGLLVIEGLCGGAVRPFDSVVLLHVIDLDLYTAGGSIPEIRTWAEDELGAAARILRDRGFSVTTRVEEGDAVETIEAVAAEEDADIIMVASAGRGGARDRFFGSTAEALAAGGERPVLIDAVAQQDQAWCRLGSEGPFARPLVAVDSVQSMAGIAALLAALPGVSAARVLHVAHDRHEGNQVRERLDEWLASFDPGAAWESRVVTGDPATRILDEVRSFEATLLVVTPKERGLRRVLRGSVSSELARQAGIPILFATSKNTE